MHTRTMPVVTALRRRFHAWPAVLLALALLTASCGTEPTAPEAPDPPNESNDRIDITNDSDDLGGRINNPNSDVPVDPSAGTHTLAPGVNASVGASSAALRLTLVAEVFPPTVEGEVVQATSVAIRGLNRVMVSYNMAGAPRLGAIDWIKKLDTRPEISASATFNDSDISALSWDGSYVYAAEATDAVEFAFPAVVERLKLKNDKFTLEDNLRLPLSSYAGTSTMRTGSHIYVTSGDGGHVHAFDKSSFVLLGQYALDDARWVTWDSDGQRIIVVQGTPGRISVFAEGQFPGGSLSLLNTFSFPGADIPESKSTAEVAGGKAFIAAGPEGVQIMCLDDGRILGSVPRPDPTSLGLDPSVVVTNAVTVDGDVMFISNGEAGVWVARGSSDFSTSGCAQQQITMIGRLRFGNLESVNHVEFKNNHLVVAAGLGGVKLVRVSGL